LPVWNTDAFNHILVKCDQNVDAFKARVFACARELLRITGLDSEYGNLKENSPERTEKAITKPMSDFDNQSLVFSKESSEDGESVLEEIDNFSKTAGTCDN
jgi:hypothetical protein